MRERTPGSSVLANSSMSTVYHSLSSQTTSPSGTASITTFLTSSGAHLIPNTRKYPTAESDESAIGSGCANRTHTVTR